MSDGMRGYVGDGAGNGDIRATNDPDGTILNAGGGDDILRGGRFNDILDGGAGDDQMFGGAGADQFRFFGTKVEGAYDTDYIRDLTFGEGDTLVFGDFGGGTFSSTSGVNAFNGGASAIISSYDGIVAAAAGSDAVTAFRSSPYNDNLNLQVTDADGQVQNIVITGGWSQYVAAGGTEGL